MTTTPALQHTGHLLMVRPFRFAFNEETAVNNRFQTNTTDPAAWQKAAVEFDRLVALLRANGMDVTVVNDTPDPPTPDAVFPNNWISFHSNEQVYLYPMFAPNRRLERKTGVTDRIKEKFSVAAVTDLSFHEQENRFLEGTGSMVLDREHRTAYACISPRTDAKVLADFCEREQYRAVTFTATDNYGEAVYHTNVMMCVADRYVVICLESIRDEHERMAVQEVIEASGKALIAISPEQMNAFAGNMLQVNNMEGKTFLVMSSRAWHSLTESQQAALAARDSILHADIDTIETNGGGSVRCMIAEVFLPVKATAAHPQNTNVH